MAKMANVALHKLQYAIVCIALIVVQQKEADAVGCGKVPEIDNAVIVAGKKSNYKTGDTIRYQCTSDSMKAAGAKMCVTCGSQGDWDISKVICNVGCGEVPKVDNAVIVAAKKSNHKTGDTIWYRCTSDSMKAAGAKMCVTCSPQGDWDISKVICKVVCGDVPKVANTEVIDGGKSKYTAGDTVQYQCADDFTEATDALMNVTCDPQGDWNTSNVICKPKIEALNAKDCWELKTVHHKSEDGVYEVVSPDGVTRSLRCDMTTDGGGWTVVQRRGDGSVSFQKDFEAYKRLFGNLSGEFWMGNDFLHNLTHDDEQMLRVEICDGNDDTTFAKYKQFSVGPLPDNYRLKVSGYSGDADASGYDPFITGPKVKPHQAHNGSLFSTVDVDNDQRPYSCASKYGDGGWWYSSCISANLNGGIYPLESQTKNVSTGIYWNIWKPKYSKVQR